MKIRNRFKKISSNEFADMLESKNKVTAWDVIRLGKDELNKLTNKDERLSETVKTLRKRGLTEFQTGYALCMLAGMDFTKMVSEALKGAKVEAIESGSTPPTPPKKDMSYVG